MVPLAADLPTNDPLFENVHSRDRLDRLPVHAKAADLLGWLCSSPGGEGSAAIADAVPKLVECGSIASNSVISTFMNLLIEFRLFALEHRISWVALKTRQAAGRPYGNDPLGTAVAEIERINWLLDSYIVALPPAIRSCIEEGDAAALCDAFGSIWGAPNREKFATQMLIYLSMQVVAKSHMCVGHEAGQTDAFPRTRYPDEPVSDDESSARKWEQATDERAFVASPSLLESTRFAILGTELVRSLLQVNSKPVFISQFTAMAMLRIGFVHLLAYKTFSQAAETSVEAWQTASREAVLSKELLATCTYVMNLSLRYVSITAHALRPTKALLEEVERAGHLVRDVIAEAENL